MAMLGLKKIIFLFVLLLSINLQLGFSADSDISKGIQEVQNPQVDNISKEAQHPKKFEPSLDTINEIDEDQIDVETD